MKNFIVYDSVGKILRRGLVGDYDYDLQTQEGEQVIEGIADWKTQYVYNGEIVDRPLMDTHPIAISKIDNIAEDEVITITGVPTGADIWVEDDVYNLPTGETVLELTFDTVGQYLIRVVAFPYQDWEREVTVV